ncbi:predicted protein [Streptomyces sp. AA4]|nr:predicted protein [Streptomyces sp. AA4]
MLGHATRTHRGLASNPLFESREHRAHQIRARQGEPDPQPAGQSRRPFRDVAARRALGQVVSGGGFLGGRRLRVRHRGHGLPAAVALHIGESRAGRGGGSRELSGFAADYWSAGASGSGQGREPVPASRAGGLPGVRS